MHLGAKSLGTVNVACPDLAVFIELDFCSIQLASVPSAEVDPSVSVSWKTLFVLSQTCFCL